MKPDELISSSYILARARLVFSALAVAAITDAREKNARAVIEGLLDIARLALPVTFWRSDSRINAAREFLGPDFPESSGEEDADESGE